MFTLYKVYPSRHYCQIILFLLRVQKFLLILILDGTSKLNCMKKIYITICLLFLIRTLIGQSTFKGFVIDKTTDEPIIFATVIIYQDSSFVKMHLTDETGYFEFSLEGLTDFDIYIKSLVHEELKYSHKKDANTLHDMREFRLQGLTFSFDPIVISADKIPNLRTCIQCGGTFHSTECYGTSMKTPRRKSKRNDLHTNDFTIFPNPASDFINLQFSFKARYLQVVNMSGQVMFRKEIYTDLQETAIGIKSLPTGAYVLQIIDAEHGLHSQMFIKTEL